MTAPAKIIPIVDLSNSQENGGNFNLIFDEDTLLCSENGVGVKRKASERDLEIRPGIQTNDMPADEKKQKIVQSDPPASDLRAHSTVSCQTEQSCELLSRVAFLDSRLTYVETILGKIKMAFYDVSLFKNKTNSDSTDQEVQPVANQQKAGGQPLAAEDISAGLVISSSSSVKNGDVVNPKQSDKIDRDTNNDCDVANLDTPCEERESSKSRRQSGSSAEGRQLSTGGLEQSKQNVPQGTRYPCTSGDIVIPNQSGKPVGDANNPCDMANLDKPCEDRKSSTSGDKRPSTLSVEVRRHSVGGHTSAGGHKQSTQNVPQGTRYTHELEVPPGITITPISVKPSTSNPTRNDGKRSATTSESDSADVVDISDDDFVPDVPLKQEIMYQQSQTPKTDVDYLPFKTDGEGRVWIFICGAGKKVCADTFVATFGVNFLLDGRSYEKSYSSPLKSTMVKKEAEIIGAVEAISALNETGQKKAYIITNTSLAAHMMMDKQKPMYPHEHRCNCGTDCLHKPPRWFTCDKLAKDFPAELPKLILAVKNMDIVWKKSYDMDDFERHASGIDMYRQKVVKELDEVSKKRRSTTLVPAFE